MITMLKKFLIFTLCNMASISLVYGMDSSIGLEPPPALPSYDGAGVDLMSGNATISLNDLSIGEGESTLSHTIATYGNTMYGFLDDFYIEMNRNHPLPGWWVSAGGETHQFEETHGPGIYTNTLADGASLKETSSNNFELTKKDGTVITFQRGIPPNKPVTFVYPSGLVVTKHLATATDSSGATRSRVQSVTTNTGLQFKYEYARNNIPSSSAQDRDSYTMPIRITAINNSVEYCSPTANSCSLSGTWPKVTYSWPTHNQIANSDNAIATVTDAGGRVTKYIHNQFSTSIDPNSPHTQPRIAKIIANTSTGQVTQQYNYAHIVRCPVAQNCTYLRTNIVASATIEGNVWNYNASLADTPYYWGGYYSDGPTGRQTLSIAIPDGQRQKRAYMTMPDGTIVRYEADSFNTHNRVRQVEFKAGYRADFLYNNYGVLQKRTESANGATGAVTEAGFRACNSANKKWCKAKPVWIKDARGYQTDYEYGGAHGMVSKIPDHAPASGTSRPQTRYTYGQHYAWYKKTSNSIVRADSPVWLLEKESTCATGAASGNGCASANDEVITRYEYGSGSSSQANNLWLNGVVVDSYNPNTGQRELRRTCYQHDDYGNRIAETQANANLASCS